MDEYLDEEVEFAKRRFDSICRAWDAQVRISVPHCQALLVEGFSTIVNANRVLFFRQVN
jgi:hypothetical protein